MLQKPLFYSGARGEHYSDFGEGKKPLMCLIFIYKTEKKKKNPARIYTGSSRSNLNMFIELYAQSTTQVAKARVRATVV